MDSFSYKQVQEREKEVGIIINTREETQLRVERERESQKKLFFKVVIGPSLEPNLPKSKADEQSHVPCNQPQPKLRSESRRSGEVSELSSYAFEEEASQTLTIDCRDAGWC